MSYEDRLRRVGLTNLETRILRADMVEVCNILRGSEGTDEVKFLQRGVGGTRESMIEKCQKI